MADVYLAKLSGKSEFAKLSVIKRLKATEDDDPEITNMFADEARLSARLNHPSIVQTFEVGEDETGPFLVMEYVEGQPLGRIRSRAARRAQPLPRSMALKVVRETIGALAYAHNLVDHDGTILKVVHRDVSPENIMVTYAGITKLIDFGVAKTAASMSKTRAGVLKGKVAYMAPEQARSDENIDERCDVFAVGLIIWELLTARRMWEGMSEAKVFETLLGRDPLPRAKEFDPTIPDDLDEVCARCLAKDPDDRFSNMGDLLDEVEKAIAKLDLRASDREIGQFVSNLFEAEREKVRALVAKASEKKEDSAIPSQPQIIEDTSDPMLWRGAGNSGVGAGPAVSMPPKSEPRISGMPPISASALPPISSSEPSLIPRATSSDHGMGVTAVGVSDTAADSLDASKLRRNPLKPILAVAGGVFVIIVAVMVGKNLNAPEPTATKPDPLPIIDTNVAPPPSVPTEEKPFENDVVIDITVKPQNAKLYLDGNRVTGNPYHLKTSRGSAIHELKAEADGHEARLMTIVFDKDRSIDINLSRGGGGWVPPPSPKPAAAPAPAPAPAPPPASSAPPPPPAPSPALKDDLAPYKTHE